MSSNIIKTIKENIELAGKDFWPASLAKVKSHLLQSQIKVIEVVIEEMKTNRYCKLHSFTGSERDSDICNECHKTREGQISSLNETLEFIKKSL